MGILERCSKWKARLTPLEEICIDMGVLFTFGGNGYGQLGLGDTNDDRAAPEDAR